MILFHIALAIFLFYAINWIGGHSSGYKYAQLSIFVRTDEAPAFNFILRTFSPAIFVVLVSTVLYIAHFDRAIHGIWLVAAYYFAFRLLYNLLLGRALLLNWLSLSLQALIGVTATFLTYRYVVLPRHALFPDPEKIGNQLWIIVFLFLYAAFNSVRTSGEASARRKNSYLRSKYKMFKGRFNDLISGQFPARYLELVAYAILLYETFNRPWIFQWAERNVFPWASHTFGPMQVYSNTPLSDSESVRKGVRLLSDYFETTRREILGKRTSQFEVIRMVLAKYNRDENYISGITELLHILWAQVATEYRTEFELMYVQTVDRP